MPLDITMVDEMMILDNLPVFKASGFEFAVDGNAPPTQRVKLIARPISKNTDFGVSGTFMHRARSFVRSLADADLLRVGCADVQEMVSLLSSCPGAVIRPSRLVAMFASRACRKAVMIGDPLAEPQMRRVCVF